MATKLESPDGELLWSPNDFGTYSTEKVQLITNILSGLLSNLTLNMNTRVDEDSLSNIYTISQTHEKFLEKENASETISMAVISVLQTMYNEGRLVSPDAVEALKVFVTNLYNVCYGLDLEGNTTPSSANSFNRRIDSIQTYIDSNYSSIQKIFGVLYETDVSGAYTDKVKLATVNDVGNIKDLDKSIIDRDNVVEAINYIALNSSSVGGNVNSLKSRVSDVEDSVKDIESDISTLDTRMTSAEKGIGSNSSSISTIENDIDSIEKDIDSLEGSISTVSTNMNKVEADVATLKGKVDSNDIRLGTLEGTTGSMRSELNTVESDIRTLSTNVGDKTSLTTDEKSSIVSALNSLVTSINGIRSSISSIEDRLTKLETSGS